MQRENALNADAETHASYGKRSTRSAALLRYHNPFERLQALLFLLAFPFLQANVDAHRVARAKFGEVFAQLRFMQFSDNRIHVRIPCRPTQAGPALQRQTPIIAKYSQFT